MAKIIALMEIAPPIMEPKVNVILLPPLIPLLHISNCNDVGKLKIYMMHKLLVRQSYAHRPHHLI